MPKESRGKVTRNDEKRIQDIGCLMKKKDHEFKGNSNICQNVDVEAICINQEGSCKYYEKHECTINECRK
jgi:hypothetical protein